MSKKQKIVVRRNNDTTELNRLFGSAIAANAKSTRAIGSDKFKDEPWDYVPNPGVSTFRGSRPVKIPEGVPFGSPVDIIDRELHKNPMLNEVDPRQINPVKLYTKRPNHLVDNIGDTGTIGIPAPNQMDSIPPEFREQYEKDLKTRKIASEAISDIPNDEGGPKMVTHYPRQHPLEDIPQMPPDPDMIPPRKPPVLPPEKRPVPQRITEDMIVKTYGYNETNIRLMGEVSKNITICSKMIALLNDPQKPVNVHELMELLQYMDDNTFRKIFSDVYRKIFNENVRLSNLINMYLSGEEENATDSGQTTGSGTVETSESDESASGQSASDQSVSQSDSH